MHAFAVGGQLQACGGAEWAWGVPIRRAPLPIRRAEVGEGSGADSSRTFEKIYSRFIDSSAPGTRLPAPRQIIHNPSGFVILCPFETRESPFPPPRGPLVPGSARGFQLGPGPAVMVVTVYHGVKDSREVDEEEEIDREARRALRKSRASKSKREMCVPRACHPRPLGAPRAFATKAERVSWNRASRRSARARERGTRHAHATPVP